MFHKGISISRSQALALVPDPICIWQPRTQFAFSGRGPQFLLIDIQPSICIYRPWLIRVGNNKSQRLHIMLLFLFLLCNFFVTAIDCCSLLLFVSRFVVRYQFIIIWWLPTCFRNSQLEIFYKKAVLQNLTIFTGKQLYWSLFLINCRLEDCNLIKKRLRNRCFHIIFLKPSFFE